MSVAWKENLIATRKVCKASPESLVEQLHESQRKLVKQIKRMGLEQNWNAKRQAEQKLAGLYYSNWLAARYPIVDLSFAQARMRLLVERTPSGANVIGLADREPVAPTERVVEVDRFAKQQQTSSRLDSDFPEPRHVLGTFTFPQFQFQRERFRQYTGRICCNRPEGAPASLRRKLLDIAAIALEARAAAVRAGVSIDGAEFGRLFLWQPRLEDLYITTQIPVRDDPAVLVTSGDRAHLVAFWDSPDENPIEGLLREFSEGAFVEE